MLFVLELKSGAGSDDADGFADFMPGLVDVAEGPLLEALGDGVVLFLLDVLVSLVEQLLGAMQTAGIIEAYVNRGVIVQVLAIINGSLFDFTDGGIDFTNSFFFFVA